MNNLFLRLAAILLFALLPAAQAAAASVVDLQTEYMQRPIGIDVAQPRFSWKMQSSAYGARQTAYDVKVATSRQALDKGELVWTTGKVNSDAQVGIVYQGPALRPSTRYYWQVTMWDEAGKSSVSAPEWFETGLFGTGFGQAQWISSPNMTLSPYRCSFIIDYDYQLAKKSTESVFVFGAQDAANYVKVTISGNQMTLASVVKGVGHALPAETVTGLQSDSKQPAVHHVTLAVEDPRGYNVHVTIDGQRVKNTHRPEARGGRPGMMMGPPDEYVFSVQAPDPDGRGIYGRLYQIGFAQPKGQQAVFSNIRISEKAWKTVLYTDNQRHDVAGTGACQLWQPGGDVSAPMLRKTIQVEKPLRRARLYATARGIYELFINGKQVSGDFLNPGWTDYRIRIMYNTFDITAMLKQGSNGVGAVLGTGWYSDMMGFNASWQDQYGVRQSLLAKIVLEYEDGTSQTIATDGSWRCYDRGPVTANSLFNGENYDARLEVNGWTDGTFDDSQWARADVVEAPQGNVILQGYVGRTIQNTVTLTAKSVRRYGNRYIYDMGQNMAGVPRLSGLKGEAGKTLTIHYAEMLWPDSIPEAPVPPYTKELYQQRRGDMYLDNYRSALSTDHYTLRGDAEGETFEPRLTSHGFRYISIDGLDSPLPLSDVKGIVLESIGKQTSEMETSNKDVNQLFSNAVWGERGNFLSVPTDCPQRDERMGWTGDAQVFSRAATYNMNLDQFYTRWFYTVRDDQGQDGSYAGYYPNLGTPPQGAANSMGFGGWQEVGVIVPWQVYQQYGDLGFVRQQYPSMVRFMNYLERKATNYIQPLGGTGDWLAPKYTNTMLTNTCYAAYAAQLMTSMAKALGKTDDARRFQSFYDNIKAAFNKTFVDNDGYTIVPASAASKGDPMAAALGMANADEKPVGNNPVRVNTQTSYVLPLQFGLFNDENKPKAVRHLLETVKASNYCLTTGFVGTPYICLVLSDAGHPEEAYRMFLNSEYPSWLFPVKQGATTFWERWNSYTLKNGFGPVSMNSFNHYAYGAIEEWMMSHCLGIQRDEQQPGYKHILLQPEVSDSLRYAKGGFETMYGHVTSEWEHVDGGYTYHAVVPANTTATLSLVAPSAKAVTVTTGAKIAKNVGYKAGKAIYTLPAGTYSFMVKE